MEKLKVTAEIWGEVEVLGIGWGVFWGCLCVSVNQRTIKGHLFQPTNLRTSCHADENPDGIIRVFAHSVIALNPFVFLLFSPCCCLHSRFLFWYNFLIDACICLHFR